jgi:hypothetical protein
MSHLILAGAALQRCGNCIVLNAAFSPWGRTLGSATSFFRNLPGCPPATADKNTLFLSFPQEVSPLHSFYTTHPHFAVALIFPLPQSACSQKREMF